MEQNARQQIIDRLKEATNVLVTVSANPSVDQLAACIGFTLLLNKLGKHGTAVFSGDIPSTIEFLKPDDTIEKNTDSLRDFIIALDKSKADKLRYKVEDKVVKIFITPYRTSLSDKDLEFSQGDFNVDAVVTLGVHERSELDQAITAHGRILHDATVISVNNKEQADLGAINWVDLNASSLSEMLVELAHGLSSDAVDGQMATAFMTGIVAETGRFSNPKTTPRTMALASELMAAGANQQLIASKLQSHVPSSISETPPTKSADGKDDVDGSLQIPHQEKAAQDAPDNDVGADESSDQDKDEAVADILGVPLEEDNKDEPVISHAAISDVSDRTPKLDGADLTDAPVGTAMQPPALGGQLTANSQPDDLKPEPLADPLSLPSANPVDDKPPLLSRDTPADTLPTPGPDQPLPTFDDAADVPSSVDDSASDSASEPAKGQVDDARDAVSQAIAAEPGAQPLEPIEALGAQPMDLGLNGNNAPLPAPSTPPTDSPSLPELPSVDASAPVDALPPLDAPAPALPTLDTPPGGLPTDLPAPGTSPALQPLAPPTPTMPPEPVAPTDASVPPMPPLMPTPNPFGAPGDMTGVNPNVPPSILPPSQPNDATAASGSPTAPPPVPPPLMPPAA